MHLAKSIQKLRRWYSVKKEIGRPSANEQNCVGKCTTFRDQTLNFLIDKYRRAYIDLLFKVENEIKDLSYEEIREKRQDRSRPILDAFWSWVDETAAIPTTNEKLTKALNYSENQKKYLETFLEDGRLPISNNLCEASIRPFATGRRAWLFADSPKGATANAVLYTLVESARANELDVYEYLNYLLTEIPNSDYLQQPEVLEKYLPWSQELPEVCKLNHNYKKCLK